MNVDKCHSPVYKGCREGKGVTDMVKIVHNKLLGGWYVVRGPHHTPISGRFPSKAAAQAWLASR
jgi:hypothetical protein